MKKIFLALFLVLAGCGVDPATANEVLEDEGYHDIQLGSPALFGCSEDDHFGSHFTAKRTVLAPDGTARERVVHGTLCCGLFKDCTVRH